MSRLSTTLVVHFTCTSLIIFDTCICSRTICRRTHCNVQYNQIMMQINHITYSIPLFQHILSDIESYSSTLEQATTLGQSLMAESNAEEKEKIEARLASLASCFKQLQDASQRRMAHLEVTLKAASGYEEKCDKFEAWLSSAEGEMESVSPFAIASQPLKTQLVQVEVKQWFFTYTIHSNF